MHSGNLLRKEAKQRMAPFAPQEQHHRCRKDHTCPICKATAKWCEREFLRESKSIKFQANCKIKDQKITLFAANTFLLNFVKLPDLPVVKRASCGVLWRLTIAQAASASASSAASTASYAAASVVAASAGVLLTRRPGAMSKTTVTALQAPGISIYHNPHYKI